mgnify:CR=1 FL=1
MKKEMYIDLASLKNKVDIERMCKYKTFAVGFSYPDDDFFSFFKDLSLEKEKIRAEYDRLFRANEIWLYATEYLADNEFQKANYLSDIMGFYKAFGVEPNNDRADSISSEFEFMYYLIFKKLYAENKNDSLEKTRICLDAQKKFFTQYLYPAVKKIATIIISRTDSSFYKELCEEALNFLEEEKKYLKIEL